ncbi:lytic transglycosylase [Testudinibacter sp. P80/BLE/0925]|uniref:lytic transglycosylase n=1 Tax=Testudinibacter sp. TW-1 TaxID=3417757 RepID=UPI003D361DE0
MGRGKTLLVNFLLLLLPIFIGSAAAIPPMYQQIAAEQGVPAEMLFAISLNESKTKLTSKAVKPWPWTLNVKGKSYFYPTRQEACSALENFVRKFSLKNIDVGLAQVNIGWNGKHFFASHCAGFEPMENLRVASIILKNCYRTHKDWVNAAGCYHHPKGGTPAARYKQNIRTHLAKIKKGAYTSPETTILPLHPPQEISALPIRTVEQGIESILYMPEPDTALRWISPHQTQLVWLEPKQNKDL